MAKRKVRKGQTQTQRQSVVVNIGTKRKTSGRGRLPPPSQQHNLAPTFITTPQIDYTNLFASLLHTTAKVKDPVPIRNPVTPLSATQSAQQMAGAAALSREAERRPGPTADNFQPLPSQSDNRTDTRPEAAKNVGEGRDIAEQTQASYDVKEREPRPPPRQGNAGQGESGGAPIATPVAEVTSVGPITIIKKKKRKPRATNAEMESRAAQASDPRQSTLTSFFTSRIAAPTALSVSRSV
jgi:hypothetical protein